VGIAHGFSWRWHAHRPGAPGGGRDAAWRRRGSLKSRAICTILPVTAALVAAGCSRGFYYIGSAEDHEYPDLQVGDEVNPRPFFGGKSTVSQVPSF
jgi:hypothetical protein